MTKRRRGVRAIDGDQTLAEANAFVAAGHAPSVARRMAAEACFDRHVALRLKHPDTRRTAVADTIRWLQLQMSVQAMESAAGNVPSVPVGTNGSVQPIQGKVMEEIIFNRLKASGKAFTFYHPQWIDAVRTELHRRDKVDCIFNPRCNSESGERNFWIECKLTRSIVPASAG